jgi:AmmeMemoRadiSam system protein A
MHDARISQRAESAGTSAAVEGATAATPQEPTVTVLPDDAGEVLLPAGRLAIAELLGTTTSHTSTTAHTGTPPAWALEPGASFVTLTENGRLRGCTGTLAARRPLLDDVRANAVAAATRDPRFEPMTPDELPAVAIEVSVLSAPRPLRVASLREAYAALRPGVDGVILETGTFHRATFLPQIWQDLPDPAQFLGYLWLKAGVEPGVWREGTALQTYAVRAWREAPGEGWGP